MPHTMNTTAPVPIEILWEILSSDPGTGVSILTLEGQILFVNERARQIFFDGAQADVVESRLSDWFPEPWVEERLSVFRRLDQEDRHLAVLRSIWNGRQIQSTMWRIPDDAKVLVITRMGLSEPPVGSDVVESKMVDLGPLDVLTTRELEVLALIGQGMRLKEIAKMLYRAPKTIENHRLSIGRKLGETDRMRLAEIARDASLELSDAYLDRLERPKPRGGGSTSNPASGGRSASSNGPDTGSVNGSSSRGSID